MKTIEDYDLEIQQNPNDAELYRDRGNAYTESGEWEKAEVDFNKAIQLDPDNAFTYFDRGYIYKYLGSKLENKDYIIKAIKDYEQAILIRPNYAEAYLELGTIYGYTGDHKQAIIYLDKALQLNLTEDYIETAQNLMKISRVVFLLENHGKEGKELDPQMEEIFERNLFFNEKTDNPLTDAYDSLMKGNYEDAIKEFTETLKSDSKNVYAYKERGKAYLHKGDLEKALLDIDQAISICLEQDIQVEWELYYLRAMIYMGKEEYDSAVTDFETVLQLNPDNEEAKNLLQTLKRQEYLDRANAYNSDLEFDKALAEYNAAIDLNLGNVEVYFYRGNTYYMKLEYVKAIADCNEAIKLDPLYYPAYITRGNAYCFNHEFDKAITDINEVIKMEPSISLAYVSRCFSYLGKDEIDKAKADLETALKLDTDSSNVYLTNLLKELIQNKEDAEKEPHV